MTNETYPEKYNHIQDRIRKLQNEIPGAINSFIQLHQKSISDGVISKKNKELIALAIAVTSNCDGCIAYHVHDSLKAGATRDEILETVSVAIMMGGGPALVYSCDVLEALTQFESEMAK